MNERVGDRRIGPRDRRRPAFWEAMGGRRFLLSLLSLLSATVLVACGAIDGLIYGGVMAATVAAYITGNTWQKTNENKDL